MNTLERLQKAMKPNYKSSISEIREISQMEDGTSGRITYFREGRLVVNSGMVAFTTRKHIWEKEVEFYLQTMEKCFDDGMLLCLSSFVPLIEKLDKKQKKEIFDYFEKLGKKLRGEA